ncbi:MAG: DUF167 family protein [Patescibacteria group bacterium]
MYIHIKVITSARTEKFEQKDQNHFLISVKEKAKNNMANDRVLDLVSLHFKISKNKARIINGHHTPTKLLSIDIE